MGEAVVHQKTLGLRAVDRGDYAGFIKMAIFGGNQTIQMAFEACSEENSALLSY